MLERVRRRVELARLRGRRLQAQFSTGGVRAEETWLTLPDGTRIYAHVHAPPGAGTLPGVLLLPGLEGAGTDFDGLSTVVTADEVAALGCVCVHMDPPGTGRSWGEYDYAGPACQRATLAALELTARHPRVRLATVGVVGVSLGIAMATPVVAEHGERLGVDWLFDWEGPGDRRVITSFGRIMIPAMGHGLDDEAYWRPREAVRHVGGVRCRYLREQSSEDHAQGDHQGHAVDMVNAAIEGECASVELNGVQMTRPLGPRSLPSVQWRPPGRLAANRAVLAAISDLLEG